MEGKWGIVCKICYKGYNEKNELVEHLSNEHELLELASYAATVMIQEEERNRSAHEFYMRFENLKGELAGKRTKALI